MDPFTRFKLTLNRNANKKRQPRSASLDHKTISCYSSRSKHQKTYTQRAKSVSMPKISTKCLKPSLKIDSSIYHSVKLLKQGTQNNLITTIQEKATDCMNKDNKQTRYNLSQTLLMYHPLFNKTFRAISEAIVLLGKLSIYYKGQIIKQEGQQFQKPRSKNDLGFMLYGKIELFNEKIFYSKTIKNFNTLFQQQYIRSDKVNVYSGRVMEETMVLWLSRHSYYTIRKECFLKMDLKYKFHEFENLLKYYFIHKKTRSQ